jgi:cell division protein FtsQ
MTKRGITSCLLTILLGVYLVVALAITNSMAAEAPCKGVDISILSNEMARFVNPDDIDAELDGISARVKDMKASDVNIKAIEAKLSAIPNLESANCYRRNDDVIAIDIVPMVPVARVFDHHGSYYLNRDGKRLIANTRYRIDVPVIIGDFNHHREEVGGLLHLLETIANNDSWNALVSAIRIADNRDVLLIPNITGHIINFGDTSNVEDKFNRLTTFYNKVLPVKGWDYYDTISVKFAGQVVARVAPANRKVNPNQYKDEDFIEDVNEDTMLGDTPSSKIVKPKIN